MNEYLQHRLTLVRTGPKSIDTARAFLERAYAPIANGASAWETAFGFTAIADPATRVRGARARSRARAFNGSWQTFDHWG